MRKRLLIVEDEREVAESLQNIFCKENFEVIVAFNGEEAKEKVLQETPDIIILDLVMPQVDGWQFLKWLRKEKRLSIPVIVISAKDKMEDIRKSYDLEADYYMVKPLDIKGIVKGVNTLLSLKFQVNEK